MQRREDSSDAQRGAGTGGGSGAGGASAPTAPGAPELVYVFSRAGLREVDRLATAEYALPSIILMENAARGMLSVIADLAEDEDDPAALVCCGRGNNGGDGLALARHLHNEGFRVAVVLAAPAAEFSGDAAVQLTAVQRMRIAVTVADPVDPAATVRTAADGLAHPSIVVDALLGTGLDGPIREDSVTASLIRAINDLRRDGCRIVAADVPSGLNADTGEPALPGGGGGGGRGGTGRADDGGDDAAGAVRADVTVTFAGLKKGFFALAAQAFLGEVIVASIGAPMELLRRFGEPMRLTGRLGDAGGEKELPLDTPGPESGGWAAWGEFGEGGTWGGGGGAFGGGESGDGGRNEGGGRKGWRRV